MSYKNVDSLELHIIKLPTTYDINRGRFFDKDSLNERFINSSNVQKKYYQLPGPKDYDTHSTEILLPPLEEGTYAYFFTNARLEETHSFAYAFTQVSNISFSKTNYNTYSVLRFVDREYGKSLKKIPVTISGSGVKNSRTYITDALGEIVVPKRKRTRGRDIDILAVNGADSLFSRSYVGYRYDPDEDDYPEAKTVMYLDRDLYRPGQTMHFKGILMRKDKGEVSTVPSEYVLVYMADANNEEIYEQYFKTNEYGSFSGSFKLPVQTLTGQFRIFTEEGDGKDEDSKFWDEIDEGVFNETRKSFRVEEYKRPTFEVLFDDIDRSFRPNDTIVVSGNAKAYLGSVISNAKVEYTINRSSLYLDRYYYGDNTENVDGGETQTDANGEFDLSFQDTLNLGPDEQSTIFLYNIEVAITDINGETRSATQSIRVSMNNLFASLMIADEIPITNDLKYNIETTNLNESHVATSGTIRIFKKKSPERFYRSRLWPAPEIQEISKEEFELHFPNEPYEEAIEADKKGALVYSNQFDGDGIFSMVEESPFREPGSYIVELEATAKDGSKVSTTREITVTSDHSKYLPDAQLFGYRIQNKNFRKDKKIELTLHSCLEDLEVGVFAFDSETRIFAENFKVNGKKRITIPLPANLEDEVAISFRMVRFNTSYSDQTIVKLPVDDSFLTIETSTFRDKLLPGVEEQWSFAIKNDKNEIVDSEVLATMYDMSLDQFGPSRWEPLDITSYSYSNRPFVDFKNMFSTTNFTFRNREVRYRFVRRTFDRLNYFGLTFGRGSWHYNAYVNRLRSEKRKEGMGGSIKGVVLDENGLPLPGVNIMVKNSSNGTQTNFDGEFSIDAKATDVLVFSYIGYLSTEQLANVNPIYITLEPNDESLEEVVVTGYSTPRSKKALGYAVTTIETSESDEIPMLQSISALPGVVAGMNVETVAGVSGAGTEFIIRSKSGIDAANRPLFVIDGVPFEFRDGDANSLRLNENEILDVSILEGLSATVLYGEKGKNGVVIISTRKGLDKLSQVAARKNLDETAFFYPHLTTDKEGKIQFNFTAPEALTRWKLRLLAHTKDAVNGRLTKEVITQKDLSIVPNAPRFLREGDTVVFSAKIANLSGKPMVGNAVLQLFDGLTMEPVDVQMMNQNARKSFTVVTGGNESVFWKVHVPDGMQAVSYKVLALAGDVSDGEQNILPVLTNRTMITESVPILVRSGEDKTFVFENFKNNDSPSLAHHKLTLEYTSNPVWNALQSLPYLMEFPHECSEQTFSRYYANSIAAYLMNSHPKVKEVFDSWKGDGVLQSNLEKNESLKSILIAETPWLRDAQSETERKKRLALLFDAEKMQPRKRRFSKN
ncbi:MAG: carboxypeptidase-like regulatory domain-containing protein [Bacteroidota bacterium]